MKYLKDELRHTNVVVQRAQRGMFHLHNAECLVLHPLGNMTQGQFHSPKERIGLIVERTFDVSCALTEAKDFADV